MSLVHSVRALASFALVSEVAELAAGAATLQEFRHLTLAHLARKMGFEVGQLQSSATDGATGHGFSCDDETLSTHVRQFVAEFTDAEIRRMFCRRAVTPDEVFSRAREDRLAGSLGSLKPFGLPKSVACTWLSGGRALAVILHRSRLCPNFNTTERALLEALIPVISIGDRLLLRSDEAREAREARWFEAGGLTPQEVKVSQLAVRGLSNREIGLIIGTSQLTVRNQLSAVYIKVHVSNRAELAFAAMSAQEDADACKFTPFETRVRAALAVI
jgi:DNA-binding CsgD family transcriptional regulator